MDNNYIFNTKQQQNNMSLDNLAKKADDGWTAQNAILDERLLVWEAHKAECENLSLKENFDKLNVVPGTSTGGFPQLTIGDGDTFLEENTFAGINALLRVGASKYHTEGEYKLRVNFHLSHHNPNTNATGVLNIFEGGRWVIYDYTVQGGYQPSVRIVPGPSGAKWDDLTKGQQRYRNQSALHTAVNEMLIAQQRGTKYTVVMNRDEEKAHYDKVVSARLEMLLPEVWEEINKDSGEAKIKSSRRAAEAGRPQVSSTRPVSEARQEFHDKLSRVKSVYEVSYRTPGEEATFLFDPSSDNASNLLSWVKNVEAHVTFTGMVKKS